MLTLVREGLTNPQIAERLGISFDAAKYHVAEILSKLGLETREEAAAWQPEPPERPVLRPVWARALAGWSLRIALAGTAAAALAGVAVLAYGVLRSGGESSVQLAGSPSASPSTSGSATQLSTVSPIGVPPGLALIVGIGGGYTQIAGIERITRSASGNDHVDPLFFATTGHYQAGGVVLPTPAPSAPSKPGDPYIAAYAISASGGTIFAALCVQGECGGVDAAVTPDSQAILYRSTDGGITWSEQGQMTGEITIYGIGPDNHALVGSIGLGIGPETYTWEPGGTPVSPPRQAIWQPSVLSDGRLIWLGSAALYFGDGSVAAPVALQSGTRIFDLGQGQFAAVDFMTGDLSIFDQAGVVAKFRPAGGVSVVASLGKGLFLGLSGGGPVLVDTGTRTVMPISLPSPGPDFAGLPVQISGGFQGGAFDRVSGAGPCLTVHTEPAADAPGVECLANDVLTVDVLASSHLVALTPVPGWTEVITPDGQQGYAQSQYLVAQ